jgi:hypothetical protein
MLVKMLETENYSLADIFTPMCISLQHVNNRYDGEMPDAQ